VDNPESSLGSIEARSAGTSLEGRGGERQHVSVFRLGEVRYAIEIAYVGELIKLDRFTSLPLTPPEILGIYNLRGTALAIVDLAKLLSFPHVPNLTDEPTVLILGSGDIKAGVTISRMESVHSIDPAQVKPSDFGDEHPSVLGIIELDGQDQATLLSGAEIIRGLMALRTELDSSKASQQR